MYLDDVKLLKANLSVQSICVVLLALLSTVSVSSDAILNSVQLFVFVSSFFFLLQFCLSLLPPRAPPSLCSELWAQSCAGFVIKKRRVHVYKQVRFYHSFNLRKLVHKAGTDLGHFPTAMVFISLLLQVAGSSQSYHRLFFTLSKNLSVFCYTKA